MDARESIAEQVWIVRPSVPRGFRQAHVRLYRRELSVLVTGWAVWERKGDRR